MPVPATSGKKVTSLVGMQVGDYIVCTYDANRGAAGVFSNLGQQTGLEIPVGGVSAPGGYFYFIKADKGLLIADRVLQNSISWMALDSGRVIQGRPIQIWNRIDNGSLNYNANQSALSPVVCAFNGEVYAAWSENTTKASQIRVKKFDGTSWVSVDGNNVNTGLNYDFSKNAYSPCLCVFNGELYLAWRESDGTAYHIRVKKFDGTNWISADSNSPVDYNTGKGVDFPKLCVFNNELYAVWQEYDGTYWQIRAKKFNGTSWVSADNNQPLNYSSDAQEPVLCVFNNKLYVAWRELNGSVYQIRVKSFDGTSWTSADNNAPLNYNSSASVGSAACCVYNGCLYLAWQEQNGSTYQIRAKKFDGMKWTSADGWSALNYASGYDAASPQFCVLKNQLYLFWTEGYGSTKYQIRAKKFDGNRWATADGNTGLNFFLNNHARSPSVCACNGQIYAVWYEGDIAPFILRAKTLAVDGIIRSLTGGVAYADANGNASSTDKGYGAWPTNNEWDKYIVNSDLDGHIVPGDDNVWHWSPAFTWTQDTPSSNIYGATGRVGRGVTSVNRWNYMEATYSNSIWGFRPVLQYDEE